MVGSDVCSRLLSNTALPPSPWLPRLLAFLLDSMLVAVLLPIFFRLSKTLSSNVLNYFAAGVLSEGITEELVLVCVTALAAAFLIAATGWFITSCVFLGLLEAVTGATPGKHLVGLRVVTAKGVPPGILRAVFRQNAKSASLLCFGFGIVLAFLTRRRQTLHDKLARCFVVGTGRRGAKHFLLIAGLMTAMGAALYPALREGVEDAVTRARRLHAAYQLIGPATEFAWRLLEQNSLDYESTRD